MHPIKISDRSHPGKWVIFYFCFSVDWRAGPRQDGEVNLRDLKRSTIADSYIELHKDYEKFINLITVHLIDLNFRYNVLLGDTSLCAKF